MKWKERGGGRAGRNARGFQKETENVIRENSMKFKFQCPLVKFYGNIDRLICLYHRLSAANKAELSHCKGDLLWPIILEI